MSKVERKATQNFNKMGSHAFWSKVSQTKLNIFTLIFGSVLNMKSINQCFAYKATLFVELALTQPLWLWNAHTACCLWPLYYPVVFFNKLSQIPKKSNLNGEVLVLVNGFRRLGLCSLRFVLPNLLLCRWLNSFFIADGMQQEGQIEEGVRERCSAWCQIPFLLSSLYLSLPSNNVSILVAT